MDDERIPQDVEQEVARHLGVPDWSIRLYRSERHNRETIRVDARSSSTTRADLFVPPDWLERKYKAGLWRGTDFLGYPCVVVQFAWGHEKSDAPAQRLAHVEAVRFEDLLRNNLKTIRYRYGVYCCGSMWLGGSSYEECYKHAERQAASMLGVKL